MQASPTPQPRKKFLVWLAAALGSFTVIGFLFKKKNEEPETITMLTEDGQLVTIKKELLASNSKKISNQELQQWIKK